MDIGISKKDREKIADGLSHLLADSFTLYLKTHNFHWNVTGPMFNSLHVMFMGQYTEQWNALDIIAEAGFDPVYGARPLKRAIQSEIENPLAKALLEGRYPADSSIKVEADHGRLVFKN